METEFRVTEKRWIHHFLHYKSMGKTIQHSRANISNVNNLIRPKFKLIRAFMPLLITCKIDKYLIKGEWEKLKTTFFSQLKGMLTPKWLVRSGRNSNTSNISCMSLLPVKKLIERSRVCHNHKPQPTLDTMRKRKRTKTYMCKTNKQMYKNQARWSEC